MIKKQYHTAYQAFAQTARILKDEPLEKHTSFKIGGPADMLALPENETQLKTLMEKAAHLDIPVTLLGGGTNLLISDKGVRGLVIATKQMKTGISIKRSIKGHSIITAGAGERLSAVCRFALDHGLSGLEFAAGIPGTLGGAVVMNAGTASGNMAGIIESIRILEPAGAGFKDISVKDLDFGYRNLNLRRGSVIVSADIVLGHSEPETIKEIFDRNLKLKNSTQPVSHASAGCFFKNPAHGMPAGELIEKSGLKGMKINDAMVSEIHANFIVNTGRAECSDVLALMDHIRKTVFEKYHINLEPEVRMKGE